MSAVEALTNAGIGLIVSWMLTMFALPIWGYAPGPGHAAGITGMYFLASFARAWALREIFRRWDR